MQCARSYQSAHIQEHTAYCYCILYTAYCAVCAVRLFDYFLPVQSLSNSTNSYNTNSEAAVCADLTTSFKSGSSTTCKERWNPNILVQNIPMIHFVTFTTQQFNHSSFKFENNLINKKKTQLVGTQNHALRPTTYYWHILLERNGWNHLQGRDKEGTRWKKDKEGIVWVGLKGRCNEIDQRWRPCDFFDCQFSKTS